MGKLKSHMVAQGFNPEAGKDQDDVFAPVTKCNSIGSILVFANQLDIEIHKMDVRPAFFNGNLRKEIYMQQAEGYKNK